MKRVSIHMLDGTLYSPLVNEIQFSGSLCGEVVDSLEWGEMENFEEELKEGLQALIMQTI